MILRFYDKSVLVGTPIISGIRTTSWKSDAKAILNEDSNKGNGFAVLVSAPDSESSVVVYTHDTPAKSGTYSLSAVLAKLCQIEGISAAMFVESNYIICIEKGVPIFEFASNDVSQIKSRAEFNYANSFVEGCSVFGNSDVFKGASDFDSHFSEAFRNNKSAIFSKAALLQRYEISQMVYLTVGVLIASIVAGGYFYYDQQEKKKALAAAEAARLAAEMQSPKALYEAFETEWIAGKRDGCSPAIIKPHLTKFINITPFEANGWELRKLDVTCRATFTVDGENKMLINASYINKNGSTNQAFFDRMKSVNKDLKFNFKLSLTEASVSLVTDVVEPAFDKSKILSFDDFIIKTGSQMQKLNQVPIPFMLSDAVFINGSTEKSIDGIEAPLRFGNVVVSGQSLHLDSIFNRFSDLTVRKLNLAFDGKSAQNATFNMEGYYVTH